MTKRQSLDEPLMDNEQVGDAVAKYLEDNPELLRGIVPAHDLWPTIESRISAVVTPMSIAPGPTSRAGRRHMGWLPMLIAASMLITASAGITYVLTIRQDTPMVATVAAVSTPAGAHGSHVSTGGINVDSQSGTQTAQSQQRDITVAHNDSPAHTIDDSPTVTDEKKSTTQLASRLASHRALGQTDEVRNTYDAEITTLHAAVDARRNQLNPSTVAIIEQNLRIIDDAIRQSRAALAKDPNSRLLNDQLDRTLAKKTGLLRAVALLPAA